MTKTATKTYLVGVIELGQRGQLIVKAVPADARLYLDDEPLSTNPTTMVITLDGSKHRLRAEAIGYASRAELVLYDRAKVNVMLTLDRDKAGSTGGKTKSGNAATTKASAAPSASTPPPDPMALPSVTGKPKPPLDESDPWNK